MMSRPQDQHWKPLIHLIKYVTGTKNRRLVCAPNRIWDGDMTILRTPMTGAVLVAHESLLKVPQHTYFQSATQKFVTLSVTESESGAGVSTAQDMVNCYRIITSLGLRVELHIILEMDSEGVVDLANN
jgi:hypothetical protein